MDLKVKVRGKLYDVNKKLYKKGITSCILYEDDGGYIERFISHKSVTPFYRLMKKESLQKVGFLILINNDELVDFLTEDEAFRIIEEYGNV